MKYSLFICPYIVDRMYHSKDCSQTSLMSLLLAILVVLSRAVCSESSAEYDFLRKTYPRVPPIKTIQSEDGDTIDCVDIYGQPAFDHPSLRNHIIQMRPSFYPEGMTVPGSQYSSRNHCQVWQKSGSCPDGTVPILRSTMHQNFFTYTSKKISRKHSFPNFNPNSTKSLPLINSNHKYATVYVDGGPYLGAAATINLWRPQVGTRDDLSASKLMVVKNPVYLLATSLEAGWLVFPQLYGDTETRLFSYWTTDGYRSVGCYNLQCPGFVQVSRTVALGAAIHPVSTYGGPQYEATFEIFKDQKTGNWWLLFQKELVGYWPGTIVPRLSDGAEHIAWGGEVYHPGGGSTATDMGSGHFSEEGHGKASYFHNIKVVDTANILRDPNGLTPAVTRPDCYDLKDLGNQGGNVNHAFFYGGPGINPDCH